MSCAPSCTIPTCSSSSSSSPVCYPIGGLGSLGSGGSGGSGSGGAVSASSLGIAPGANVGCINQTPPSELTVLPAPFHITIPGVIISASCEPVRVGGYTACGGGGGGSSSGGSSRLKSYPCKF